MVRPSNGAVRLTGWGGVLFVLVIAGCGEEGEPERGGPGDHSESEEAAAAAPGRPANLGELLQTRGDTVELKMDEYVFGLPSDTLPAGRIVFQIQNLGFEFHNLEILLGDSLVASLDDDLSPAEIRFLEVTLEPGEYQFLCTVSGHDTRGMLETVTIIPDEG